jgi:hypothetical protein
MEERITNFKEEKMKKITILVLTFALVFVTASSFAQGITAKGLLAGLNLASVSGDDMEVDGVDPSSSMGFAGGAFLVFGFSDNLGFRPEVQYGQHGAKWEEGGDKVTAKVDYLDIPLLLQFTVPTEGSISPFLIAGPYVAFNLSAKVVFDVEGMDLPDLDIKDETKSLDYGLIFGAGVAINDMIEITARYGMGLTSTDDTEEDLDIKNKTIHFTAGIRL